MLSPFQVWAQDKAAWEKEAVGLNQLEPLNTVILTKEDFNLLNINDLIQNNEYAQIFPEGVPESGNQSVIIQEGQNNQSNLQQYGDKNGFGLLQVGDGNSYGGLLVGEDNLIRVLQLGNNNIVIQDLDGDGMRLDIIQEGNNHEIVQIEKDGTSPAYQIHQQGTSGMKIIIEHKIAYP